jgi:hypothetical protein
MGGASASPGGGAVCISLPDATLGGGGVCISLTGVAADDAPTPLPRAKVGDNPTPLLGAALGATPTPTPLLPCEAVAGIQV